VVLENDQTAYLRQDVMSVHGDKVDPQSIVGRYGVVVVRNDRNVTVRRRLFPKMPSRIDVWVDARWRRLPNNELQLYYNAPQRCPGFLVLAYARAGPKTSVATLRTGLLVLDEIAKIMRMQAIVCEATNPRLTSRVMDYFGYIRHAQHLKGYHYIKRFATRSE
jgi:hypothetical protein